MARNQIHTERLTPDQAGIARAAMLLGRGELVAFPTETVYGLGADARNDEAVASIFSAKGRPSFNPLIIHVTSLSQAEEFAVFDAEARRLAATFWPGPLTLVVPQKANQALSQLVSAGLPTVAIRVPEHPLAHQLLRQFQGPLAAPSANPSGKISPTRAEHVLDELDGKVSAVLDGGPCTVGIESTIIGFDPTPILLRSGGVPVEAIENCLSLPLAQPVLNGKAPNAPGQLSSHYAPTANVRLNAMTRQNGEVLLGFGPVDCDVNLSPSGDLREAAANLFDALRVLDERQPVSIAVSPIPEHGIGQSINDRLRRAAAPR